MAVVCTVLLAVYDACAKIVASLGIRMAVSSSQCHQFPRLCEAAEAIIRSPTSQAQVVWWAGDRNEPLHTWHSSTYTTMSSMKNIYGLK